MRISLASGFCCRCACNVSIGERRAAGGRRPGCRAASRTATRRTSSPSTTSKWSWIMRAIPEYPSMPHSPGMMCTSGISRVAVDTVAEIVDLPRVVVEGQRRTLPPERPQGPPDGAGRRRPDVLAVPRQHAAEDPRQQDDDVAHRPLHAPASMSLLPSSIGPAHLYQAAMSSIICFGDGHLRLRRLPGDVHTAGRGRVRRPRRRRRWWHRRWDVHDPALGDRAGAGRARGRDDPCGRLDGHDAPDPRWRPFLRRRSRRRLATSAVPGPRR